MNTAHRFLACVACAGAIQGASLPAPAFAQASATTPATRAPATRFATDDAVREGMRAIRTAMQAQEAAIAANQLDRQGYIDLAKAVDGVLQGRLAQHSLPKPAAVAFRGSIWQDLEHCAGLLRDGRSVSMQRTGALGVQQVLRNYPVYFDHPGW